MVRLSSICRHGDPRPMTARPAGHLRAAPGSAPQPETPTGAGAHRSDKAIVIGDCTG
jgi:hypothetical protein